MMMIGVFTYIDTQTHSLHISSITQTLNIPVSLHVHTHSHTQPQPLSSHTYKLQHTETHTHTRTARQTYRGTQKWWNKRLTWISVIMLMSASLDRILMTLWGVIILIILIIIIFIIIDAVIIIIIVVFFYYSFARTDR